jgi:hypothetical protein
VGCLFEQKEAVSEATFKTPSGRSPTEYILEIAGDVIPTEGDAIFAAQRQVTRILERTLSGVDVDGNPFEPYSTNGPYYYYPNGRVGRNKAEITRNKAAVSRLLKRLANVQFDFEEFGHQPGSGGTRTRGSVGFESIEVYRKKSKNAAVLWTNPKGNVVLVHRKTNHDGQGIRFDSYADFKRSLGRLNVDLRGPRAPHMLQAFAIGTGIERTVGADLDLPLDAKPRPAQQVIIGIYGEEAGRATGHNTGINPRWKKKHQRRFLGASENDLKAMNEDISERCVARVAQRKA